MESRSNMSKIFDWHIVPEDSLSDHRKISFALQQDRRPSIKRRNVRKTDWDTYQSELDMHMGLWLGSVHTPADIERELDKVDSAIIQSYETACPTRKCSGRKKVPWWNHELSCLRKKANRAFHIAYWSRSDQDWDQHHVARRNFKTVLHRNKQQEWRNFCARTESIHESARLYKIQGFSPTVTLGMLRLPDGQWTTILEEA